MTPQVTSARPAQVPASAPPDAGDVVFVLIVVFAVLLGIGIAIWLLATFGKVAAFLVGVPMLLYGFFRWMFSTK